MKITKLLGLGLMAVLIVAPTSSHADTPAKRVARLDGDHRGVSNPDDNASARALIKVHRSHRTVCYRIRFERMTAFHADIRRNRDHRVVTELYHERPTDGPLEGCVNGVGRRTLKNLRVNPGRFYVLLSEYNALGQPPSEIAGTLRRR